MPNLSTKQIFFQYQSKTLEKWKLNFSRNREMFCMNTTVCLKYFLNDSLWKLFFACKLPQTSLNLIFLTILVILRPFTQFYGKIRAKKYQNLPYLVTTFLIFSLRSKFGIEKISSLFYNFFQKGKVNSSLDITAFNNWNR